MRQNDIKSQGGSMEIPTNGRMYDLEQPRYFVAPVYPSHAPGYFYTLHRRDELEAAAQNQGVSVGEGDVVLVRTGNGALWQDPTTYLQAGGVSGGASSWLASRGVRAVGADNAAWDEIGVVDPDLKITLPGH